jgi:hypothetical protein
MTRLLILLALVTAACGPHYYALSTPPPGRVAIIDDEANSIRLSLGVAVAFRCEQRGPCEDALATSDDPAIAEIRSASLARLETEPFRGEIPATTFVVVGRHPGSTTLRIATAGKDGVIRVTVEP